MPAIVDKVLSLVRRKSDPQPPAPPIINHPLPRGNKPDITVRYVTTFGQPQEVWGSANSSVRVEEGYTRNSDVYACVSLIATAAKQVKWWDGSGASKTNHEILAKAIGVNTVERRTEIAREYEEKLRTASEHERKRLQAEYAKKLNEPLDPKESVALLIKVGGAAFIEQWASYLLLYGNDYIEVVRPSRPKVIDFLYLTNPSAVQADVNRDAQRATERELVTMWRVSTPKSGYRRPLAPYVPKTFEGKPASGDLIHSKLFNPTDAIYGMAPLEAAMLRVTLQNEAAKYGRTAFERGFVPGWIEARPDSSWTDEQVAQMKERIRLSKMAGEELFMENATWHQSGFAPADSGMYQLHELTKRDIASVYHVDPALIGDTQARTYATYRESRRGLYMEAVVPLLTQFRDDWNRTIGAELQSPLDFDRDSFDAITAAREEAADRVTKLWQVGLITQNEGRADLEYGPAQPGDTFYAPASMVPLGETNEVEVDKE